MQEDFLFHLYIPVVSVCMILICKYLLLSLSFHSMVHSLPGSLWGQTLVSPGQSLYPGHPQHRAQTVAQSRCSASPVKFSDGLVDPRTFQRQIEMTPTWSRNTLFSPKLGGKETVWCVLLLGRKKKKLDFILFADRDVQESVELCWGLLSISF